MPSLMMVFDIVARDSASGTFTKAGASAEAAAKKIDLLGKAAFGATAVFAAFAVKDAANFESAMTRINTQAGVPIKNIKALSDAVLQLSPKVGFNPTELAAGLYHVESAFESTGITSAKSMSILQTAAEGAKVGNSDLVDTTNALDAAIVSGIPGVKNFQQAMGALNAIVGTGDMTMQQLSEAFGTGAVAVVKNYGLSLTDVGAALAVFGDNNIRGADAGTALRMSVQALAVPVAAGKKALDDIGISTNQLRKDMSEGGLNKAMTDLVDHMNQAGITGSQVGGFLTEAFGKRAGTGVGVLVSQFDRLESKYPAIQKASGDFAQAVTQNNKTTKQQLADLGAAWDTILIQFGEKILPVVKDVASELAKHPALLKDAAIAVGLLGAAWAALKIGGFIADLGALTARMLGLGIASETAAAKIGLTSAAAQKSALGVTGIGTAVSRIAGGAALAVVASGIYEWATAANKAQAAVDKIQKTITDPNSISQLQGANKALNSQYDSSHAATSGVSGILKSTLNTLDFGLTGPSGMQSIDTANKSLAQLRQNQGAIDNIGIALSQLHNKFGLTTADLETLATKGNIGFGTTVASLVKGEGAFDKLYGSELRSLPVNQQMAKSLDDSGGAASKAGSKIDALSGIVGNLINKQAGSMHAADAFQMSLNDLGKSLDTSSHTLVGNTDAAINNRAAIFNLIQNANDSAVAYAKGTGKAGDYSKALQYAIPLIEATAEQQGISKDQIQGIITNLGLMPKTQSVTVTAPGAGGVLSTVNSIAATLANMPKLIPINIQVATTSLASQFSTNASVLAAKGNIPFAKAAGGLITGPGTGTSDSIHAMLSNGEYVIPAHVVKQMGVGFFDNLRGGSSSGGTHFAAGGLVGLNPAEVKYLSGLNEVASYLKTIAAASKATTASLTTFVQQQQAYASSLKSTVTSGGTITDLLAQSGNAGDLKQLFAGKIGDIQTFASKITALKQQGWPDAIVREIASDGIGPGVQYADLLLNASAADRTSLIGDSSTLSGLQSWAANSITSLTGGTAGITMPSVLANLNNAALNGGNTTAAIAAATAAQVKAQYAPAPLIHVEHVSSTVDLQLIARQASFLQSAGHFG